LHQAGVERRDAAELDSKETVVDSHTVLRFAPAQSTATGVNQAKNHGVVAGDGRVAGIGQAALVVEQHGGALTPSLKAGTHPRQGERADDEALQKVTSSGCHGAPLSILVLVQY
jgi:hypothetical protein